MRQIIKLEEVAMFLLSLVALYDYNAAWYAYLAMFLAPDISMLAYLAGNKAGAICYNIFHHKATGITMFAWGFYNDYNLAILAGIIIFGHAALDRIWGYGLKHFTGFSFTHLGRIGKHADQRESFKKY